MVNIRRNIFETNSSSTHSVTFYNDSVVKNNHMNINDEGFITVDMEGFCSTCCYDQQSEKLCYVMQLCACTNDLSLNEYSASEEMKITLDKLYSCEEFLDIQSEIINYIGPQCKGIRFSEDSSWGYIDDGYEYKSVSEFLAEWNTDLISFIFGPAVLHYSYNG